LPATILAGQTSTKNGLTNSQGLLWNTCTDEATSQAGKQQGNQGQKLHEGEEVDDWIAESSTWAQPLALFHVAEMFGHGCLCR
jgi:hypothetical protein